MTGLSKEASVRLRERPQRTGDLRRIADAVACAAIPVLICALPPAIIKRWAGGDAERRRAARAEASLDCT